MNSLIFNLILFGLLYTVLLCIIFIYRNRKKGPNNDSDDDSGLPVNEHPILDLPPGICLPDGPSRTINEKDEILA